MLHKDQVRGAKRGRMGIMTTILLVVLILYALSMLVLLLWGVAASLKGQSDFRRNVLWLPQGAPWTWKWSNYKFIVENFYVPVSPLNGDPHQVGIFGMIVNTLLYAGGGAFVQTTVTCLVAYVTAKFPFRFSKVIYTVVIVTMILPVVGSAPSELQLVQNLHLIDTYIGSWVQKINFLGMYYLVFYAVFRGIPKDFSEAAYVDGAGETRVLLHVVLPQVAAVFFTVVLIRFIEYWNDYQAPTAAVLAVQADACLRCVLCQHVDADRAKQRANAHGKLRYHGVAYICAVSRV